MIDIDAYMNVLVSSMKEVFGRRLVYTGLQGSYRRGEADLDSDIDVMVVLDELRIEDMATYRKTLTSIDCTAKSCGFICGKKELSNWNSCEIFQLIHETQDYFGTLTKLVPAYTLDDIRTYVKLSVGNLYHEICHRYIHSTFEANKAQLKSSYKQVFYILQNICFLRDGNFIRTKGEMLAHLDGEDLRVMQTAINMKTDVDYDFNESFQLLFSWCQRMLQTI